MKKKDNSNFFFDIYIKDLDWKTSWEDTYNKHPNMLTLSVWLFLYTQNPKLSSRVNFSQPTTITIINWRSVHERVVHSNSGSDDKVTRGVLPLLLTIANAAWPCSVAPSNGRSPHCFWSDPFAMVSALD